MAWIGAVVGVVGSLLSANASKQAGKQQKQLDYVQAQQVEAVASHQAENERRRTKLVVSRAQALAAAGGGSATDASVLNVISDIEGEGAYRASMALYEGENQASAIRAGGDMANEAAKQRATGYYAQAADYVGKGFTSYYGKFGSKPSAGTGLN